LKGRAVEAKVRRAVTLMCVVTAMILIIDLVGMTLLQQYWLAVGDMRPSPCPPEMFPSQGGCLVHRWQATLFDLSWRPFEALCLSVVGLVLTCKWLWHRENARAHRFAATPGSEVRVEALLATPGWYLGRTVAARGYLGGFGGRRALYPDKAAFKARRGAVVWVEMTPAQRRAAAWRGNSQVTVHGRVEEIPNLHGYGLQIIADRIG
jgi:hypothetical protein